MSISTDRRLLVFSLAKSPFAISLSQVREVIALPAVIAIPNSPPYFLGVTNLRGLIVSILDLRQKLAVSQGETGRETTVVILNLPDANVGMVVDSVDYVMNLTAEQTIAKPTLTRNTGNECIEGVLYDGQRMIVVLDPVKVLNDSDRAAIEVAAARQTISKAAA